MPGGSAVTWDEVAVMVSQTQAVWKAGARSGASCLTRADFLASVINDGQLPSSSSLVTLDEFNARKQINARLVNDVGSRVDITLYDNNAEQLSDFSVNSGSTTLLDTRTYRIVYQFSDNTRGGLLIYGSITPVTPGATYRLREYVNQPDVGGGPDAGNI